MTIDKFTKEFLTIDKMFAIKFLTINVKINQFRNEIITLRTRFTIKRENFTINFLTNFFDDRRNVCERIFDKKF